MKIKLIAGLLSLLGIIVYHECTSGAPLGDRVVRYIVVGISFLAPAILSAFARGRNYYFGIASVSLAGGIIFYFFQFSQSAIAETWKMELGAILLFSVACFLFMAWVELVAFASIRFLPRSMSA